MARGVDGCHESTRAMMLGSDNYSGEKLLYSHFRQPESWRD